MATSTDQNLICDVKISSAIPGQVTSDFELHHHPTCMDLAMKLHYLRCVYFFSADAAKDLTITDFKHPMYSWLNHFPFICGRFRRSDSGRPFIKCNDCGIRVIEARCPKTVDEWLETDHHAAMDNKLLVPNKVIGPDLVFSPPVLMQITWFKCGGKSVGLSWAHVLGDPSSASYFINVLGQVMAGHYQPNGPLNFNKAQNDQSQLIKTDSVFKSEDPLSAKRVDPVGDCWIAPSDINLETYSFRIGPTQLTALQSKMSGDIGTGLSTFESICAIIWQCMGRIREDDERIRTVTVCKNKVYGEGGSVSNRQSIGVVKSETPIVSMGLEELAMLLGDRVVDEEIDIETRMEEGRGLVDFIVYGKNLTFIDLGGIDLYGFELKGQQPKYVSYDIEGIGDEGVVLVIPAPKTIDDDEHDDKGRIVTVKLPQGDVLKLKAELETQGLVV